MHLGYLYDKGLGVEQNYTEAVKGYRLAANQGLPIAQSNLAKMLDNGLGVAKDYKEAARMYRLAANQGVIGLD